MSDIRRASLIDGFHARMEEAPNGDYVLYSDHLAEIERLRTSTTAAMNALAEQSVGLVDENARLRAQVDKFDWDRQTQAARAEAAEAKLDALMLEFCPDEMTHEQRAHYAAHQIPMSLQPELPER